MSQPEGTKSFVSVLRSNWKAVVLEASKDIGKTFLVWLLGALAVFVLKIIPPINSALNQPVLVSRYHAILIAFAATLLGFLVAYFWKQDLVNKLKREARTDRLTGLLNLRALEEDLPKNTQAARRTKQPLALIFLDVDNFGELSKRFPFEVASDILRQCAATLKEERKVKDLVFRYKEEIPDTKTQTADLVFRYGGDEFLILAPGTDVFGGRAYADKLRNAVANSSFRAGKSEDVKLSVSAGVTELDLSKEESVEDFKRRAEVALLRAKKKRDSDGQRGTVEFERPSG
jgi:GGDEF domain-containing protein